MSHRINISVPDDLFIKMQSYKENLNISQICQNAISRAVEIAEMKEEINSDIDKLAAVFEKEIEEYEHDFWNEGFRDGTKDAFKITDFDWMYTVYLHQDVEEFFSLGASQESKKKVESGSFETKHEHPAYLSERIVDRYYEGWRQGFLDVWERVSKKLSTRNKKK